jgi:hypothetical protein
MAIKNPERFSLVIFFNPAIMDWKENLYYFKKIMGTIAAVLPKLPTIK